MKVVDKLINILFKGVVLLLPLFFCKSALAEFGMDNSGKLFLLYLLIPVFAIYTYFKCFKGDKLKFRKTYLDKFILMILLTFSLSTVFSIDKFSSLWGFNDALVLPLCFLVLLFALYYFVVNTYQNQKDILGVLKISLYSYFAVLLISCFNSFRHFRQFMGADFVNALKLSTGFVEDIAIMVSVFSALLLASLYFELDLGLGKRLKKLIIFFSFFLLVVINFSTAWLLSFFAVIVIVLCTLSSRIKSLGFKGFALLAREKSFASLLLLFAFISVFTYINFFTLDYSITTRRLATELRLDLGETAELTKKSIKERTLFGYGLNNFSYAASFYRNPELNKGDFWYLRFNKTSSFVAELFVTVGVLGALTYLGFILFVILGIMQAISKSRLATSKPDSLLVVLAIAVLTLIFSQFVYSINIVLYFTFWLFLALFIAQAQSLKVFDINYYEFKNSVSKFGIKTKFGINLFLVSSFFLFTFLLLIYASLIKYRVADRYYDNARGGEYQLSRAIRINPNKFEYHLALSGVYLDKAIAEANKGEAEANLVNLETYIKQSVDYADNALSLSPNSVVVYENLGIIYRNIGSSAHAGAALSIKAFESAIKLEPSNPVLHSELAKAFEMNGERTNAILSFRKALELKSNYYDAGISLARLLTNDTDFRGAIVVLEGLIEFSSEPEIYYELGRAYHGSKKYEEAITQLSRAISASPTHANSLYIMGLSHEALGDTSKALYYFKKTLNLNPNNQELSDRIKSLE